MEQSETIESVKSSRSKMTGKSVSETHREYLDMDTDEEEFGRQETPESLDEAPPEPDKPEFTDAELEILVAQTKALTILPNLSESSWNESCIKTIREYFCEPANPLLSLYFLDGELCASLDLPEAGIDDAGLAYFLREPWQVYRSDDFLGTVTFGSIGTRIELAIFKFVSGLYAPLVFKHKDWTEIMRDEIFSNLNNFLEHATELAYKPTGMLILYTPWEGVQTEEAQAADSEINVAVKKRREEEQIGRLEMIARTWVKRIRAALVISLVSDDDRLYDLTCEFEYWQRRYENLVGISRQLKSERVLRILRMLVRMSSSSIKDLKLLKLKVNACLKQAESNLAFLNLVLEECKSLKEPNCSRDSIKKMLLAIRFVWTESNYYNDRDNVERLLCALSVQIVKICVDSINLQLIFDDPKSCRTALITSLRCCSYYSKIYANIIDKCLSQENNWQTDRNVVFNSVEAFEQRCRDVIEICDAIIVYGSLNEITLGGTRGDQHEIQYSRVKEHFLEITRELRIVCSYALDIKKIRWFEDMLKFKRDIAVLENTIKNLMESLFEDVGDVEMGIETLYTLLKFKDRQGFRDILHDKWMQVWKLFYEEIKLCSLDTVDYDIIQDKIKSLDSESSLMPMIHKKYLAALHKMMIDASDWLGDCDVQTEILKYLKIK